MTRRIFFSSLLPVRADPPRWRVSFCKGEVHRTCFGFCESCQSACEARSASGTGERPLAGQPGTWLTLRRCDGSGWRPLQSPRRLFAPVIQALQQTGGQWQQRRGSAVWLARRGCDPLAVTVRSFFEQCAHASFCVRPPSTHPSFPLAALPAPLQ